MKIAIPLADGKLTPHFGHCQEFALIEVEGNQIMNKEIHVPPPHEPGLLPGLLQDKEVEVVIAGGMGQRAISLFDQIGISVITGAPEMKPEELIVGYLNHSLITGSNACDH